MSWASLANTSGTSLTIPQMMSIRPGSPTSPGAAIGQTAGKWPAVFCYVPQRLSSMHFDLLPKVIHNQDAIREYERGENQRIRRRLKRSALLGPVILILAWLILHFL